MTFNDITDLAEKAGCDVSAIDGREHQTMWCDCCQLERFAALMIERDDLTAVFSLLNEVERRMMKKTVREVKDAALAEQIVIELEQLGLKEAA